MVTTLKPRVTQLSARLAPAGSWRAGKQSSTARGYGYRWQQARARHLKDHPLCVMCSQESPSKVTVATVVDHRTPHRGDERLFWDERNWQSLCAHHHSSEKQKQEAAGGGAGLW